MSAIPGLDLPWKLAADLKNRLYDRETLPIFRASVPVISVGNLTMGGTGKTPLMIDLVQLLEKRWRVAVINRSYRGSLKTPLCLDPKNKLFAGTATAMKSGVVGDEALLLQQKFSHASVFTGPNKSQTAEYIMQNQECDVIIVDDGYQHRRLHRDCNILLLDATEPMENYACFPKGRGRESFASLLRADLIFLTKVNLAPTIQVQRLIEAVAVVSAHMDPRQRAPVFQLRYLNDHLEKAVWTGADRASSRVARQHVTGDQLEGFSLVAVSGIGQPSGFEKSLKLLNLRVSEHLQFADHHNYTHADGLMLQEKMKKNALVTTEKDFVKLSELSWPAGTIFFILCQRVEAISDQQNPYEWIWQKAGLVERV